MLTVTTDGTFLIYSGVIMSEYIDDQHITFGTDKIYIRRDVAEARGVFAKEDLEANDLIERFTFVPLHFRTLYQGDVSLMRNVIVKDDCPCNECKTHGYQIFLPQGYASTYNYADDDRVNAEFKINYEKFYGLILATKEIKKDAEIFVPANQSYHWKTFMLPQLEINNFRELNNEIRP